MINNGYGILWETWSNPEGRSVVGNVEDPQPDTNPSQLWLAVKRTSYAELRGEAESKKASLEGGLGQVWGVNPKPALRIVGVVGAGLHADASAR